MKEKITISESLLRNIIKEEVYNLLKEGQDPNEVVHPIFRQISEPRDTWHKFKGMSYSDWAKNRDFDNMEYEFMKQKKYGENNPHQNLFYIKNGKNIETVVDRNRHAIEHLGYSTVNEILHEVDYDHLHKDTKGTYSQVISFPFNVGYLECVETGPEDEENIIFARRGDRKNVSRFVLNREGEPCRSIVVVFKPLKEILGKNSPRPKWLRGRGWFLLTAYMGTLGGVGSSLEPWDKHADPERSKAFWQRHAFITSRYGHEDNLGDSTYWTPGSVYDFPEDTRKIWTNEGVLRKVIKESINKVLNKYK